MPSGCHYPLGTNNPVCASFFVIKLYEKSNVWPSVSAVANVL